jgi:hypothetical protein
LYKSIMDAVERNNIGPTEMAKFQELRQQEYNLLLINEAMIEKTDGLIFRPKLSLRSSSSPRYRRSPVSRRL